MPWIHQIGIDDATGPLKAQFDAAIGRAGRVWNIVHVMSLNPRVMDAMMVLYGALMFGDSALSRMQREMIATVVSSEVGCFY